MTIHDRAPSPAEDLDTLLGFTEICPRRCCDRRRRMFAEAVEALVAARVDDFRVRAEVDVAGLSVPGEFTYAEGYVDGIDAASRALRATPRRALPHHSPGWRAGRRVGPRPGTRGVATGAHPNETPRLCWQAGRRTESLGDIVPDTKAEPTTIADNLAAALALVQTADRAGLPAPFDIHVTDHSPTNMQFLTLDKLTDWSLWLESPIGAHVTDAGHVHHSVEADTDYGPLRLVFVERVAS